MMNGYSINMTLRNGARAVLLAATLEEANRIIDSLINSRFPGWASSRYADGTPHGVHLAEVIAYDVMPR